METKAAQSAADLDAARCRGDWSAVPDLAKHYKKYHPDESVLEATASIEAEFAQIVERQRRLLRQKAGEKYPDHVDDQVVDSLDQRWRSTTTQGQQTVDEPEYQHDGPEKITLSVRLTNGHCQTTQQKLSDIIKRKYSSESPDEWQAQFTKIILARVYFESGRYKEALEALQNLALRLEDATSGYGLVLLVQARTVKGVCYEMQGDIKAAEDAYEGAWNAVEQYNDEMSDMLIYWIEESLYRGSLLCLRSSDQWGKALRLLRAYSKLASSPQWPKNWRLYKQWVIHRYYAKLLVDLHRRESYIPQSQGKNDKEAALEELTQLLGQSRKLLTTLSLRQIPPKTLAKFTVDLANTIVEAHDTVGWGTATNIRRVLQFLYRAKEWTFNTTCIVRYLLLVLIRLGDHAEAVHAFGAYLTLIGIPDLLKSETDDIPNPNVATAKIKKKLGVLHRVDDTDEAQQDETIIDIIQTLTVGAELYGKDMENGRSAAIIASVALDLCENENQDYFLQAKCYQIAGVSYGVLAAQTSDPDTRSKYQQQAVQYLRQATKLDDKAWQALYELAVQQAITRDVVAAASTAMRSIQLKRDHLPSWNLLALVYSCKHFYQTPQALQTLATGLAQTDILEKTFQVNSDTPAVSWSNDEEYSQAYFYAAEAYLQSKISQIHLLESTEGSEAVLNLYTELFTVYAKFSQQLGLGYGDDALLADPVGTPASMNSDNGYFSNLPESQSTLTSLSRRSSRSRSISIYDRRRSNSTSMPPSSRRPSEQLRQNSMTDTPPLSPSANGTNSSSIAATRKLKTSTSEETKSARTPTTEKPPPLEKHQRVSQLTRETKSIRKKSLQLMELGLARRIGNAQQSSRDDSTITPRDNSSPSLSSLLTPAYSVSSRRSSRTNSVSIEYRDAPLQRTNSFMQYQRERWYQILTKLWLMSTACFVRAGRLEEATKAVVEAEQQLLDGRINDAGVWHQMGKICLLKAQESGEKELHDTGLEAWRKALSIDPEHVDTSVDLAKYYIDHDEWELAEGLLDRATQGRGWDNAKAWYLLSECYRHNDNPERAKDCLLYALELDDTTPIQPFTLLPRFV